MKTRRTTGGSYEEQQVALREKVPAENSASSILQQTTPKLQRSPSLRSSKLRSETVADARKDMHIDDSGMLKNIPKLRSTLSSKNGSRNTSDEKAASEIEQAFSKINPTKVSKYDELTSRLDNMMEEAARKREERKIADVERRERKKIQLEEEEQEYKRQLDLKWLRKQEQLEEERRLRDEKRKSEELRGKNSENPKISGSLLRASERADALLKRFSFQSQDAIPEEEEREEEQQKDSQGNIPENQHDYTLQNDDCGDCENEGLEESFYSTRSKVSSLEDDCDEADRRNNAPTSASLTPANDVKSLKVKKSNSQSKDQTSEAQPMDMLIQLKLKAAAREQQKTHILQAGNINLGVSKRHVSASPLPEMTELIHSSCSVQESSCASNAPLELISEIAEYENRYKSSSDIYCESSDEEMEDIELDPLKSEHDSGPTFDGVSDDDDLTPTIMPLPITRETSRKLSNVKINTQPSQETDIFSLIAGSKNGDDHVPHPAVKHDRSKRQTGAVTATNFHYPQTKVDEFPVDDGLDDFYVPIVKNVTPLGTRRNSIMSGFSTGYFVNNERC